jgi:hypothetical protein
VPRQTFDAAPASPSISKLKAFAIALPGKFANPKDDMFGFPHPAGVSVMDYIKALACSRAPEFRRYQCWAP